MSHGPQCAVPVFQLKWPVEERRSGAARFHFFYMQECCMRTENIGLTELRSQFGCLVIPNPENGETTDLTIHFS